MNSSFSVLAAVFFTFLFLVASCKKDPIISTPGDTPVTQPEQIYKFIPPSPQRNGDAAAGYDYLVYGDYLESGVPIDLFLDFIGGGSNLLNRTGDNAQLGFTHNAVTAPNGTRVVTTNCLTCHAQKLNGELIIGLGNAVNNYAEDASDNIALVDLAVKTIYGEDSPEWKDYEAYSRFANTIAANIVTDIRGVNPADKITATLAAHINKHDLSWLDQQQLPVPEEVIPSDVPAWWLLRKKNAMFYNGIGRGDFARIMQASSGLTMGDTTKAREVDQHFDDVLAFINSIEAPEYPESIDLIKAERGEQLFNDNCAKCHGTYGDQETYPNLLILMDEIGTDPELTRTNFSYPYFANWYNTSWFSKGDYGAYIEPQNGYVAPPLDGIWATAPYLHNGSVPTLEDVLDSTNRPEKWRRTFSTSDYDYERLGWNYSVQTISGSKLIYDSTLKGYGNQGHTYGDHFTNEERKDLLEYLKTL